MQEPENELVSVVMATWRGDRLGHFQEAVAGVLAQTWTPLELVIVANGPLSDAHRAWTDALAEADTRVRVVRLPENVGPAGARNAGFAEARGAWIAVADADDLCEPNRVARQVAFLRETGADLAGSDLCYMNENGEPRERKTMPRDHDAIRRSALRFSPINNPTVLARATVFREEPYNPRYRVAEDYELWVRLLRSGRWRLGNVPEPLVRMRRPDDFYRKRRGWTCFVNDLAVRMRALPLYPSWTWTWRAPLALGLSALRLMPAPLLARIYLARNKMG
jgi:GT2 family glycosyltransferase